MKATGGRTIVGKYTWDHIHLRSTDPGATAAWFERMLGAEVLRSPAQGGQRIDLKLGGANIFIAPVTAGDGVNPAPRTPYQGLDHFGLMVSGIDAIAAELRAKGVEFTKEPTTVRPGVRICFIRGPEGVSIELLDRNHV
jgi:lactoylglutathione lyase